MKTDPKSPLERGAPAGAGCVREDLGHSARHWFIKTALSYLGTPYIWGGDDPSGYDCSGFVVECLKSVGLLREDEDLNADGLYRRFCGGASGEAVDSGQLVFWLDDRNRAYHVSICLDSEFMIGASGGDPEVVDSRKSWQHNAFVKIRPIPKIRARLRFADPFGAKK